jgi:SulP family sulfate permease
VGPVDGSRRHHHLGRTVAEHVFDIGEGATTRRRLWSNPVVTTAPGRHRSLFHRGPLTVAAVLPGLVALRGYRRAWLRGDVLAGVTVAAYLVPQVMAYAQVAGLAPAAGLVAVVGPTLAYAVLGTSRQLSVGPESTTALMTATALLALGASSVDERAALAAALAVVCGALCVLGWLLGLGFLADLLSRPVLIGYLAGVAVLMVVSQVDSLLGIRVEGDSLPDELWSALGNLDTIHWPTAALAAGLLALLFLLSRFAPRVPGPLVVVLLGAAVVAAFHLTDSGVRTVGALPDALPHLALPHLGLAEVGRMLGPALGIAVVAYSDNVLTARAFAARRGEQVDANQEFLALGGANVLGGVLGGFPVSSSGSRTAIGDSVGSRTQLSSLATLAAVVLAVLTLEPVIAAFPQAALGALVVYAATRLVDVAGIRSVARFRRSELVLLVSATLGVFLLGALYGVLLAVALSLGDLLRRVARGHDAVQGFVPGLAGMHDVDDYPDAQQLPGLVVFRYDSPLFFANADDFRSRALLAVEEAEHPVRWFVVNAEANVEVDYTSLEALDRLRSDLAARDIVLGLARVKQDLVVELDASGVLDRVGRDMVFPTLPTAVAAFRERGDGRAGPERE